MSVRYRKDRKKWIWDGVIEGKRVRRLFDKEVDAKNFAKMPQSIDPKSITISEAIASYFNDVSEGKTSKENDRRYFNLMFHFLTGRGLTHLCQVQLQDLEAFQKWLGPEQKSDDKLKVIKPEWTDATVNRAFNTVKNFFKRQRRWGKIEVDPCIDLDQISAIENDRKPMTEDEYLMAYDKAPDWFKPTFQFIRLTGSPPSVVERLKWANVDLKAGQFSMLRKKGAKARWKWIRQPLTDELFQLFVKLRNSNPGLTKDDQVFRNEQGLGLSAEWCSKVGNRAIKAAGFDGELVLYCLRHSIGADMTDAGVPTEVVRQVMGHSKISTTQRYAKGVKNETLQRALELVRGEKRPQMAPSDVETVAVGAE